MGILVGDKDSYYDEYFNNGITNYRGYVIEEDNTGYAPKHLRFHFFELGDEIAKGCGESIEDCKRQIDEIID